MKYLLLFLLWGYNAGAQVVGSLRYYDSAIIYVHGTKPELIKCKHIYVAIEPDTVLGDMGSGHDALARVGFHDGKEVVCLKCHHVKNQIIDYDWFWRRRPADLRVGYGMDNRPDTLYFDSTKNQMRLKSAGRFWSPVEAKKNK